MSMSVAAAAIQMPDGKVYTLPPPARHHDLIKLVFEDGGDPPDGIQGFVSKCGNFLTREGAAHAAYESGQIAKRKRLLFSEDLW